MKRTDKRKFDLNEPLIDLNKSSSGCAPCLNEALKIERQMNGRSLNEIKIKEIKYKQKNLLKHSLKLSTAVSANSHRNVITTSTHSDMFMIQFTLTVEN